MMRQFAETEELSGAEVGVKFPSHVQLRHELGLHLVRLKMLLYMIAYIYIC